MAIRKVTIRSLNPISLGQVQGVILASLALVFGVIIATLALLRGIDDNTLLLGLAWAIAAIVGFPLVYGVSGFISGVVLGLIYNQAAGTLGGIRITFTYDEEPSEH